MENGILRMAFGEIKSQIGIHLQHVQMEVPRWALQMFSKIKSLRYLIIIMESREPSEARAPPQRVAMDDLHWCDSALLYSALHSPPCNNRLYSITRMT